MCIYALFSPALLFSYIPLPSHQKIYYQFCSCYTPNGSPSNKQNGGLTRRCTSSSRSNAGFPNILGLGPLNEYTPWLGACLDNSVKSFVHRWLVYFISRFFPPFCLKQFHCQHILVPFTRYCKDNSACEVFLHLTTVTSQSWWHLLALLLNACYVYIAMLSMVFSRHADIALAGLRFVTNPIICLQLIFVELLCRCSALYCPNLSWPKSRVTFRVSLPQAGSDLSLCCKLPCVKVEEYESMYKIYVHARQFQTFNTDLLAISLVYIVIVCHRLQFKLPISNKNLVIYITMKLADLKYEINDPSK